MKKNHTARVQQKKFHEYIKQTMKKYPNVSREERGNMIRGALIRLTDGHDIEVPEKGKN